MLNSNQGSQIEHFGAHRTKPWVFVHDRTLSMFMGIQRETLTEGSILLAELRDCIGSEIGYARSRNACHLSLKILFGLHIPGASSLPR